MSQPRLASICLVIDGNSAVSFERCLAGVLEHTPLEAVELRLGISQATSSLHYSLGLLCPDGVWPQWQELPGGVERFHWTGPDDLPIQAWHCPRRLSSEQLLRLLFHDVPLDSEYAVCLDSHAVVAAGWWPALAAALGKGTDYLGQPGWADYSPEQMEAIQAFPWYMGVPFARREGRLGVPYMKGGLVAVRSRRLREAGYPDLPPVWQGVRLQPASEVLLGESARQLGWSQATYAEAANTAADEHG